jgi:hypothetical protein
MIRFDSAGTTADWHAIDDRVMGGESMSWLDYDARGYATFSGVVSLANHGGFASVRCRDVGTAQISAVAYVLRVKGDGKVYKFSVRTVAGDDGPSYQARFQGAIGDWTWIELPVTAFTASWRGRSLLDAPPLDSAQVKQMGFLIADRQTGPFWLAIESIGLKKESSWMPVPVTALFASSFHALLPPLLHV